ncbi:MAG: hypothetical protein IPI49_27435 [Myxococcales bacterium]|nr:hypothetical protein [Myxococcales bacterium]
MSVRRPLGRTRGHLLGTAALGAAVALWAGLEAQAQEEPAPAAATAPAAAAAAAAPAPKAKAEAALIAALVPDLADVRKSTLLGPSGQLYAPSAAAGALRWIRSSPGGVAATVRAGARLDGEVVAAGSHAPLFRRRRDQWAVAPLGQRGRIVLGTGPVFSVAIGKQVFVHHGGKVVRVGALATGTPTALWAASDTAIFVATEQGVSRRRGAAFVPVPQTAGTLGFSGATPHAITRDELIDLRAGTRLRLPGGAVLAVVSAGKPAAVVELPSGKLALTRDLRQGTTVDLPTPSLPLAAAVDGSGRAVIALASGLHVLDGATWSAAALSDALPPARPGPAPARSR